MINSTSEREQRPEAPETIYFAVEDISSLADCLPVTPFVEPMRGQCVAYLRESTETAKLLSDAEWESLSAESRFNITAYLARQEHTATSMRDLCMEKVRTEIPTSWLDSLLTGPQAVIGKPPYNCVDIERLLRAISTRVTTALQSVTLEQEQK